MIVHLTSKFYGELLFRNIDQRRPLQYCANCTRPVPQTTINGKKILIAAHRKRYVDQYSMFHPTDPIDIFFSKFYYISNICDYLVFCSFCIYQPISPISYYPSAREDKVDSFPASVFQLKFVEIYL